MIPAEAEKPADNRVKTGVYRKAKESGKLPLPIGVSEYIEASSEYYYVDKTMLIKEFIDERPKVSLITRPRRFGKTLNMDMLRVFFEKSEQDTSVYFKKKKIWSCGNKYQALQGKFPVIFISFKDIKKENWEETYKTIVQTITLEYKRHPELAESRKISDKEYYHRVIAGQVEEALFDSSLFLLSKMLHEHYEVPPMVIIDEYDTPIWQGYMCGFYDEVILFMRNLFSGCFKDNRHLSYGFMAGILRVAKESIFSGLNNLKINSVLDNKYSEYFGFTSEEVREMARYYGAEDKYEELCAWYDGYRFGKTEIFNPWSVINYFNNDCEPRAFWQSTGSNDVIGEILGEATPEIYERLKKLLQQSVSYYDAAGENFYHGLVLGLCAMLDNRYYITSNRESGDGRYDIRLMPKTNDMPGILVELKADKGHADLRALAQTALQQIEEKNYDTEMRARGIKTIFQYGVAFRGKEVEIEIA